MRRTLRVANASGYWGDDPVALARQVRSGTIDYATLDFLAEISVTEQLLYEIGDPARYLTPDVVTDFPDMTRCEDVGGRPRERSSWPTGSGGIGSAQGAQRPSTGRAPGIVR